jgi:hypothetical protein
MNNKIKQIVKNVENGTVVKHKRSYNHIFLYEIFKGKKLMYSEHDETMPGVTVYFQNKNDNATTIVYCANINDAFEIIEYQEKNRIAIHDAQKALGKYIREHKMY